MTTATQFERQDTQVIEDREPKSGSQLLLEAIAAQGVDTIFGYPGGAIMPVYDVLPTCLLYTSPSPRDKRQSRMPSSA